MIRPHLRSNVVGYLALFVAMSGTAVALPATNAADAAAATGDLLQKPGAAGCLSVIGFCERGHALDGAQSITVSPDGQSAYVVADNSDAVAVFDRAGDGTLIQKRGRAGCISNTGAGRCRDGTALDAQAFDGASLSVAVSPDGKSAYVASRISEAVAVFDRTSNGRLIQKPEPVGCISEDGAGPCIDGTALDIANSVAVSPDGLSVYVTSRLSNAVAVFDRATNGTLAQKPGTAGCIRDGASGRRCVAGAALAGASSVAVSPDGLSVYVTSDDSNAVAVFDREPNQRRRSRRRGSSAHPSLSTLRSRPSH